MGIPRESTRDMGEGLTMNCEGIDLVAISSMVILGIIVILGHDGAIIVLMSTIIGYYFGTKKSIPRTEDKERE